MWLLAEMCIMELVVSLVGAFTDKFPNHARYYVIFLSEQIPGNSLLA